MNTPPDPTAAPNYVFSDVVITALWREIMHLACEDAIVRQLRRDKGHEPPAALADQEDMENIGRAFMESLHRNMPDYSWSECPSEVIVDLINQRDDARASQPPNDELLAPPFVPQTIRPIR